MTRRMMVAMVMTLMMIGMSIRLMVMMIGMSIRLMVMTMRMMVNVDNDHSACVQQVNGVKERMTRRKFRDFLHDQIGISSQVIADRIFVYFNKVFSNQIYFWESVVDSVVT